MPPKLLIFQCRVFGDDPVAEPRCAAGSRSSNIIISSVRPEPDFHEKEFGMTATAASRRRQRVGRIAGRSADRRLWVGATLARARIRRECG